MTLDNGWRLKMPRNRPGRPRTNDGNDRYGFTMGEKLMTRFDAIREKKEAELGIQLSRTQILAMLVKKEEEEQ